MKFDINDPIYEWTNIEAVVNGRTLEGIRGFKYGEKAEREYLYAKGNKPYGVQTKNISYEGEITVLQNELERFIGESPNKSILDLVVDTVTFSYVRSGGLMITDQLVRGYFLESIKEMKQGDGYQEITLPIMFLDLKQQI